jgi:hypothetical protein
MKDPVEVAAVTAGAKISLEAATVYVCRHGISPSRSREIGRQVLACYQAGIAPTFAATYQAWLWVNQPTETRNHIVGGLRVLH